MNRTDHLLGTGQILYSYFWQEMPFKTTTVMEQKIEFVQLAKNKGISFTELCKRFKISRPTGYKWIYRYQQSGLEGLQEQSRRPHLIPNKLASYTESLILSLRDENPEWGAKKIHRLLLNGKADGLYKEITIPARSTINQVLKRNGRIDPLKSDHSKSWKRFEYPYPNALWQMDFKGYFMLTNKQECHPLTIIDDNSRYNIGLVACKNERYATVRKCLEDIFEKYGLPETILTDNGSPWGLSGSYPRDGSRGYTQLEKWFIQHQIKLIHGKPFHPQTQGKEERFHRTLKTELLQYNRFKTHQQCQKGFNHWREKYNHQRPHEALSFEVPAKRYMPSNIQFNPQVKKPEYPSGSMMRYVDDKGLISFKGKEYKVGKAFCRDQIAIVPTQKGNMFDIYYYNHNLKTINLNV